MDKPINCKDCRKKLTDENCTLISDICDDCLANRAADSEIEPWDDSYIDIIKTD